MDNNEILRYLRKALATNEVAMAEIFNLSGPTIEPKRVKDFLRQPNEAEFVICPDSRLNQFLDALIQFKRGSNNNPTPEDAAAPTNNQVLKKLRIAYDLKDGDMHTIFETGTIELSKQELKSLFRNQDNKNFKACDDKLLRGFLKGLIDHSRG